MPKFFFATSIIVGRAIFRRWTFWWGSLGGFFAQKHGEEDPKKVGELLDKVGMIFLVLLFDFLLQVSDLWYSQVSILSASHQFHATWQIFRDSWVAGCRRRENMKIRMVTCGAAWRWIIFRCSSWMERLMLQLQQGLVNVPFWVYWTSPYSSHLVDHIPNGWVMFNGDI